MNTDANSMMLTRWTKPVGYDHGSQQPGSFARPPLKDGSFQWDRRKERYPVSSFIPLPKGKSVNIPSIQHNFESRGSPERRKQIKYRRDEVKAVFERSWRGYRNCAWMKDELAPIRGGSRNHFGGWSATLVDSLDTLFIMGMMDEFAEGVHAIENIDFTTTEEEELNTFETTIRYMGGLLAGYDLSGGKYPSLLAKALELGDLLYAAFDTPNRMPVTRWHWKKAMVGKKQEASGGALLAELGSLTLEFTRLSQLSGDPKFYDAVQRISNMLEQQQPKTKLPGLWPIVANAKNKDCTGDNGFTLGAMADSTYEYLPKHYLQLGGLSQQPQKMYKAAIQASKNHNFIRPMTKDNRDILISVLARVESPTKITSDLNAQHLVCFAGGMIAMASKIFNEPEDLKIARKLVDGCIWSYEVMPNGIMAETFFVVSCESPTYCEWDEARWLQAIIDRDHPIGGLNSENLNDKIKEWHLVPGISQFTDRRYILRPEVIESVFILYRITGDEALRDTAWKMFQAIDKHTKTEYGNAALDDVTVSPPSKSDSMESFWTAETLKYSYLIFSEPELVSLHEFVFNTEAHPFRRP